MVCVAIAPTGGWARDIRNAGSAYTWVRIAIRSARRCVRGVGADRGQFVRDRRDRAAGPGSTRSRCSRCSCRACRIRRRRTGSRRGVGARRGSAALPRLTAHVALANALAVAEYAAARGGRRGCGRAPPAGSCRNRRAATGRSGADRRGGDRHLDDRRLGSFGRRRPRRHSMRGARPARADSPDCCSPQ